MITPKVTDVKPLAGYMLHVFFENGAERLFDVKPYICGSWFGELKNVSYFNLVHAVDGGIEWPNGQDVAPHELYGE